METTVDLEAEAAGLESTGLAGFDQVRSRVGQQRDGDQEDQLRQLCRGETIVV